MKRQELFIVTEIQMHRIQKKGLAMALHPLIIKVEVTPTKGRHGWWIEHNEHIITHHNAPESRDANEYIINTIAQALGIPHSHITILKGFETRFKEVRIGADVTREELYKKLNVQMPAEKSGR